MIFVAQATGAVESTDCIFADGLDTTSATSVLDITSNNLIFRLQ